MVLQRFARRKIASEGIGFGCEQHEAGFAVRKIRADKDKCPRRHFVRRNVQAFGKAQKRVGGDGTIAIDPRGIKFVTGKG